MTDLIAGLIILAILGAAIGYIVHAKRSGKKCLSCPAADCPSKDSGSGSCCCTCSANLKIDSELLKKQ